MDAGAKKLLETVAIETLHANNFSRASSQATHVLTDLLSRYLSLLSATCAKYAEHAGRLRLSAQDAALALDELGVGVDELSEYCTAEGRELARYARHPARRIEDLHEFKAALTAGMREDRDKDDVIPLMYAPLQTPAPSDDGEESSEGEDEDEETDMKSMVPARQLTEPPAEPGVTQSQSVEMLLQSLDRIATSPRPVTPTLPLSPISNPSTPPRKRPRTASWDPPEYVPDFLPPFPTDNARHPPTTDDESLPHPEYSPHHHVKLERPVTPPPETGAAGSADYLRPTPYAQSSLAGQQWHLPEPPHATLRLPPTNPAHSVPRTDEAIVYALHHALTNKPPDQLGSTNPARYKVALELIAQTEENSRWEPPATLYASSAPNLPRVAPVGPGFPIPVAQDERAKEGKDKGKEVDLEQATPALPGLTRRTIISNERLAPLVNSHTSKTSTLLKAVVEYGLYQRSTKVMHPPVLSRGAQKLTYGPGINAPWNSGPAPPAVAATPGTNGVKGAKNTKEERDAQPKPLPDARLYATWGWEEKSFRESLVPARRPRMGSVQLSAPMMGNGKRARSESHS